MWFFSKVKIGIESKLDILRFNPYLFERYSLKFTFFLVFLQLYKSYFFHEIYSGYSLPLQFFLSRMLLINVLTAFFINFFFPIIAFIAYPFPIAFPNIARSGLILKFKCFPPKFSLNPDVHSSNMRIIF